MYLCSHNFRIHSHDRPCREVYASDLKSKANTILPYITRKTFKAISIHCSRYLREQISKPYIYKYVWKYKCIRAIAIMTFTLSNRITLFIIESVAGKASLVSRQSQHRFGILLSRRTILFSGKACHSSTKACLMVERRVEEAVDHSYRGCPTDVLWD